MNLKQLLRIVSLNQPRKGVLIEHRGKLYELADRVSFMETEQHRGKVYLVFRLIDAEQKIDKKMNHEINLN